MSRLAIVSVGALALSLSCIHKRDAHLAAEGGAGSGSGSVMGSGMLVDGELVFHWKIDKHVLTPHAQLADRDARQLHGRILEITNLGYTAPWQGTCESAERVRQVVALDQVVAESGVGDAGKDALVAFGFGDPVVQFALGCDDMLKAPPLHVWLSNEKLFTCFQGVCYLMSKVTPEQEQQLVQGTGSGSGFGDEGSGSGSGSGRGSGSGSGRGSGSSAAAGQSGATGESMITNGSAVGSNAGPQTNPTKPPEPGNKGSASPTAPVSTPSNGPATTH